MEGYLEDSVKQRLIISGMEEICEHGLADFSLRRAALRAQVSCAAPYRHFKDKEDYLCQIIEYVNSKWSLLAREIESAFSTEPARLVVELCMANLKFYIANPKYRSVLIMTHHAALGESLTSAVNKYLDFVSCPEGERAIAHYTVKVIISGSVMLLGTMESGELLSLARKKLEERFT